MPLFEVWSRVSSSDAGTCRSCAVHFFSCECVSSASQALIVHRPDGVFPSSAGREVTSSQQFILTSLAFAVHWRFFAKNCADVVTEPVAKITSSPKCPHGLGTGCILSRGCLSISHLAHAIFPEQPGFGALCRVNFLAIFINDYFDHFPFFMCASRRVTFGSQWGVN